MLYLDIQDSLDIELYKILEYVKINLKQVHTKKTHKSNDNATDKQIAYIKDLCENSGYELVNSNINKNEASDLIGFLAYDKDCYLDLNNYIQYV